MVKLSLKAQNVIPLSMLTLFSSSLALLATKGGIGIEEAPSLIPAASTLAIAGVVAVWLSYLIAADLKHMLIFLKVSNALPGHQFIALSEKDSRVDNRVLISNVVDIDQMRGDPKRQNQFWYGEIYRPIKNESEIAAVHRSFLLYRDAATVALIILMLLGLIQMLIPGMFTLVNYKGLGVIGCFMIFFSVAANTAGKRFVTTSVAVYLSSL
jgi:hypothetical protein